MKKNAKVFLIMVVLSLFFTSLKAYTWSRETASQLQVLFEEVTERRNALEEAMLYRSRLAPELVRAVFPYANWEIGTVTDVNISYKYLKDAIHHSKLDRAYKFNSDLDVALNKLFEIADKIPELSDSETIHSMHNDFGMAWYEISVAKKSYNDKAKEYNQLVTSYPYDIVAKHYGFKPAPYFQEEDDD